MSFIRRSTKRECHGKMIGGHCCSIFSGRDKKFYKRMSAKKERAYYRLCAKRAIAADDRRVKDGRLGSNEVQWLMGY